jgi:hypothetical protein
MINCRSLSRLHAAAGLIAWCLIASFFIGSLISEFSGNPTWIVVVKRTIFYTMWTMVVLVPVAALTGRKLAGKSGNVVVERKRKRMRWIAPNGLLLLTLGSYLYYKASQDQFDPFFRRAQLVELAVGLTNLLLLGLMIRDGYRLKRRDQGELPQTLPPTLS